MIDSHQHFWIYHPEKDSWISDDMAVLKSNFLPQDLKPILSEHGFDGCVAVQATQSDEETAFLLSLAAEHDIVKAVVGWVDLLSPTLEEKLAGFSSQKKLKGFRHVLQGEPDGFMSNPQFIKGVNTLGNYNYTYDLLIFSRQLTEALKFVSSLQSVPVVIDHIAKPEIAGNEIDKWKSGIMALSKFENVYCKISGMVTEAKWNKWKPEDFIPYLDVVFQAFGPERVMYGSDWPVCLLSGTYKQQLDIVLNYISQFSTTEQQNILGGNARRFYNI